MPRAATVDRAAVARMAADDKTDVEIAAALHCNATYVRLIRKGRVPLLAERMALGLKLQTRQVRSHDAPPRPKPPLALDHPAVTGARTLYPRKVAPTLRDGKIFGYGKNSTKIGGRVLKGKWAGMPIFTLALEERATCPTSCKHWADCYGNNMQWAIRVDHTDPDFERALLSELMWMRDLYPAGFVIRLHVLGDFYSVEYVDFWRQLLALAQNLRVFGYTARTGKDPIGRALQRLVNDHWDRFAVRFSDSRDWEDLPATTSIKTEADCPPDAVVCPAQIGKTEGCGTCGFCWHSQKRVAFINH